MKNPFYRVSSIVATRKNDLVAIESENHFEAPEDPADVPAGYTKVPNSFRVKDIHVDQHDKIDLGRYGRGQYFNRKDLFDLDDDYVNFYLSCIAKKAITLRDGIRMSDALTDKEKPSVGCYIWDYNGHICQITGIKDTDAKTGNVNQVMAKKILTKEGRPLLRQSAPKNIYYSGSSNLIVDYNLTRWISQAKHDIKMLTAALIHNEAHQKSAEALERSHENGLFKTLWSSNVIPKKTLDQAIHAFLRDLQSEEDLQKGAEELKNAYGIK